MKKAVALFFAGFLFAAGPALSQTLVWKNYSSMYDVTALTVSGGKVWGATTGGVFSYTPGTSVFAEYTTTEGLSNIQATAIASDSSDRVIVGEEDGSIDELDSAGNVLRSQLAIAKSTEISKQITNLSVVGDTIFVCTPFGVVLISRANFGVLDTYSHFDPNQGSIQANSAAVFNGHIYVASEAGLSYAPRSAINLAAPDLWVLTDTLGMSAGVTSLTVAGGSLLIGTAQGLLYTTDGTTFHPVPGLAIGAVNTLSAAPGFVLVNADSGLYKLQPGSFSNSPLYRGGSPLNGAVAYSGSEAFGATGNGLLVIGTTVSTALPPGPATNVISNLTVDASGNLWCSTNNTNNTDVAFMKFNGTAWTNYNQKSVPELKSNLGIYQVSAVCGDRIIVGTWGYGMVMLSGDSAEYFGNHNSDLVGEPNDANYVIVGSAACDNKGNIWMTNPLAFNGNTLVVYSPSDSTWHSFHNGLTQTSGFKSVAIDNYGGVWTGDATGNLTSTAFNGLFYYNANGTLNNLSDDRSYVFNTGDSPILSNRVNSVIVDNEDQVWIGTDLGMDVIYDPDPSASFYIQPVYSLYDQYINDIAYDALDRKWVATKTGVYVVSKDGTNTLASYNITNSPLPSNNVTSVAFDRKDGIVYFATDYGVTELKTGVLEPAQSFPKLKVFPDPAVLSLAKPVQIRIEGLVANSEIKVFTVDGRLVDQFQAQGGKIAYWNGTDSTGKLLSSGIYIIVAYSSDGSQSTVGKIAVIRR